MGDTLTGPIGLVIDGEIRPGADGTYPVTNPVRPAEVVFEAPAASQAQLDQAVRAARRAQPAWAALDHDERAAAIVTATKAAGATVADDQLDRLLTREHGKVLWEANFDSGTIGAMAEAFAPMAQQATMGRASASGATAVRHEPHGVVAALLPFNWPVAVMANKILPALLTGNTVVVKAPPTCPGAVLLTAASMAAHLPPGVLNVVNGPGPELGAALVAHPGVDMISFTGGVPTGRAVMASAAIGTKPVVLELGGNDPALIAPDVVFDAALADKIAGATFVTSGQVCMAIKRLYVHESRLDDAVEALTERLSAETIGDGLADGVTMGPVHRPDAKERVDRFVAQAEARGATVRRPATVRDEDKDQGGYLVNPALVIAPPIDSDIVVEEQFAPALPIIPYTDLDQAVAQANDTTFGLCASIWSNDRDLAASVAGQLEAGTVFVNTHGMSSIDPSAPMGGWKQSGFGVELGPEGFRAFTRQKVVLTHGAPGA